MAWGREPCRVIVSHTPGTRVALGSCSGVTGKGLRRLPGRALGALSMPTASSRGVTPPPESSEEPWDPRTFWGNQVRPRDQCCPEHGVGVRMGVEAAGSREAAGQGLGG